MPEPHRSIVGNQDAAAQALIDCGKRLARCLGQKGGIGAAAKHRGRASNLPRRSRKPGHPCQYGISHRDRHMQGASSEHLSDVERVSASALIELVGVQSGTRII